MERDYKKFALLMKALSDETRIQILDMLYKEELCACNILEEFKITQPTLSYHMKILSDSGLVIGRKDGVWMKYSLNVENVNVLREFFDCLGQESSELGLCTLK
ncbi:MAG: transcriptional regulator, ArsR family [Lachnospiraceae bacterium]|nr:transcriptional regulator, ArsR family [Lachnospiraceae bacterium]